MTLTRLVTWSEMDAPACLTKTSASNRRIESGPLKTTIFPSRLSSARARIVVPLQCSKHFQSRDVAISSGADRLGHDPAQVVVAGQLADLSHTDQTVGVATKQHGEQLPHLKDIIGRRQ